MNRKQNQNNLTKSFHPLTTFVALLTYYVVTIHLAYQSCNCRRIQRSRPVCILTRTFCGPTPSRRAWGFVAEFASMLFHRLRTSMSSKYRRYLQTVPYIWTPYSRGHATLLRRPLNPYTPWCILGSQPQSPPRAISDIHWVSLTYDQI